MELLHKYQHDNIREEQQQVLSSYSALLDSEFDILVLWSKKPREELKNEIQREIWRKINLFEQKGHK